MTRTATATGTARTGTATTTRTPVATATRTTVVTATGTVLATITPTPVATATGTQPSATATATSTRTPTTLGASDGCEPLNGAAEDVCQAFCDQGCALDPDRRACHSLRDIFEGMTGRSIFPCEDSGTPRATATGTRTPAAGEACFGDCNGDGGVSIGELTRTVLMALEARPDAECPSLGDRPLTIQDLILAVRNALLRECR